MARPSATTALVLGIAAAGLCRAAAPPVAPDVRLRVERAFPRAVVERTLAWAHVRLEYGRAEARGRRVFGALVPYGRVWRLGADEATRLTTDAELSIGALRVPPGSYALFAVPQRRAFTLLVNTVAEQWGAWNRNPAEDLGRVELPVAASEAAVETLTLDLVPNGEREAILSIAWEHLRVEAPVRVVGDPPAPAAPAAPPPNGLLQ